MERPKYRNPCRGCRFLGGFEHKSERYDLYYCGGQLVQRYGNEPDAQDGFLVSTLDWGGDLFAESFPAIIEAHRRAQEKLLV